MLRSESPNFSSLYTAKTMELTRLLVDVLLYIILNDNGGKIGRSFKRRNIVLLFAPKTHQISLSLLDDFAGW